MEQDIVYQGRVKITLKQSNGSKKDILIHNNGLDELFRIISKALAGYQLSRSELPTKIELRRVDPVSTNLLSRTVFVTASKYEKVEDSWCSIVTGVILTQDVAGFSVEQTDYRLYLCSLDEDLAYVSISSEDIESIQGGAQALIEWKLIPRNSQ